MCNYTVNLKLNRFKLPVCQSLGSAGIFKSSINKQGKANVSSLVDKCKFKIQSWYFIQLFFYVKMKQMFGTQVFF